MNINWTNITQADFINHYWQQKPVVLKNAIAKFADPIDANDLAGLAMEEVVESRIVKQTNNKWNVQHGPFKEFDDLPEHREGDTPLKGRVILFGFETEEDASRSYQEAI